MKLNLFGTYMEELERIGLEKGWIKEASDMDTNSRFPVEERSHGGDVPATYKDMDSRKFIEERRGVEGRKWVDPKINEAQMLINTYLQNEDPVGAKTIIPDGKWGEITAKNWNHINKDIDGKFDFVNAFGKVPPSEKELNNMIFVMKNLTKSKGTVTPGEVKQVDTIEFDDQKMKRPSGFDNQKQYHPSESLVINQNAQDNEKTANYKIAANNEEVDIEILEKIEEEVQKLPLSDNWIRLKSDPSVAYNTKRQVFYDYEDKKYYIIDPKTMSAVEVCGPNEFTIEKNKSDQAVKDLQNVLNWKFKESLKTDGIWGPKTQQAWKRAVEKLKLDYDVSKRPGNLEIKWFINNTTEQKAEDKDKNEQAKNIMAETGATATEALNMVDNTQVIDELVNLANDLDEMGEIGAAIAVDKQLSIYKKAVDKLYDVTGETGEKLISDAHPGGGVTIAPSQDEGGKIETVVEQQKKDIARSTNNPTGKVASTILKLIATANKLEEEGLFKAAEAVDKTIKDLLVKYPFQNNGLVAATNPVVKKNAAIDPLWVEFWNEMEPQMFVLAQMAKEKIAPTIDKTVEGVAFYGKLNKFIEMLESGRNNENMIQKVKNFRQEIKNLSGNALSVFSASSVTFSIFLNQLDSFINYAENKKNEIERKLPKKEIIQRETEKTQIEKNITNVKRLKLERVSDLVGTLTKIKDIINENKHNLNMEDMSIAQMLDSIEKDIVSWNRLILANKEGIEITDKQSENAKNMNIQVWKLLKILRNKFEKKGKNITFLLSKRADWVNDLTKALGPSVQQSQKPGVKSTTGHGGGSVGYAKNLSSDLVKQMQSLIMKAGDDSFGAYLGPQKIDGKWGRNTQTAYDTLKAAIMAKSTWKLQPLYMGKFDNEQLQRGIEILNNALNDIAKKGGLSSLSDGVNKPGVDNKGSEVTPSGQEGDKKSVEESSSDKKTKEINNLYLSSELNECAPPNAPNEWLIDDWELFVAKAMRKYKGQAIEIVSKSDSGDSFAMQKMATKLLYNSIQNKAFRLNELLNDAEVVSISSPESLSALKKYTHTVLKHLITLFNNLQDNGIKFDKDY